jgi:predicted NBD/HSP70 family sugar kinase
MSLNRAGASADALRQRNLSTVLRLVASHGPISRADLVRRTGLNRSTVGALVAELTELGFVGESYPATSQGLGRPSLMVSVNDRVVAVALHLAKPEITVALVGLGGVVHRVIELPLERVPTMVEAVNMSAAVIDGLRSDLSGSLRVVGIGAALPGLIHQRDGVVMQAPTLGWEAEPFSSSLSAATGLPVLSAGEAQLAAIAEAVFGAGRDVEDVIYLTGGISGTWGGIISGGSPLRGANGYAGDFGHMIVAPAGELCGCGSRGCLNAEIGIDRLLQALDLDTGEDASDIDIALRGALSESARTEVERQLRLLALALLNAIRILDPDLVVLGGYLGSLHEHSPGLLIEGLKAAATSGQLQIVRTERHVDDAVLGAGQLAFNELLNNPSLVALQLSQLAEDSKHWSKQRFTPEALRQPQHYRA